MDRLTRIRTLDGESNIVYGNYLKITDSELKAVVEKLSAYEDTNLTPEEIEALKTKMVNNPCKWVLDDDDSNTYLTSCGELFCIENGTPKENYFNFCVYCGRKLEVSK